jgi:hypothetical protein
MLGKVIERFKHGNPRLVGDRFRISAKHLAAYVDEMTFRFNNRQNPVPRHAHQALGSASCGVQKAYG